MSPSKTTQGEPATTESATDSHEAQFSRRSLLIGTGAAVVAAGGYGLWRHALRMQAAVFVAKGQRYDGPLARTIRDGLLATGFQPDSIRGRRVLLKPNLVEPSRHVPHMTTHPSMVLAAAEVFRSWGATVVVGEAPGHIRDTEFALIESGLQEALDSEHIEFRDLNYEEIALVKNRGRTCKLPGFYFPRSVVEADLIVSLPKMKTHHWVGVTGAMKNLYGTLPGIKYGWPKNVLHFNGIPQTVHDINASLPRTIAIVDGITCMEGDGPILGTPKSMGLVLVGTNATAVDATMARIMGLDPAKVSYLRLAEKRLGPLALGDIQQRGESIDPLVDPFQILDADHLRPLRDPSAAIKVTQARSLKCYPCGKPRPGSQHPEVV